MDENDIKYPEIDYFMNESMSDVVFLVEDKRVPSVKKLLSIKSRVFRAMFSGSFKEAEDKEITIKDTTFEAFKTLIRFIYCDQLVLIDDNDYDLVREVLKVADRYQVFRLIDRIGQHLKNKISIDNFESISQIAFDLKMKELSEKITEFIETNFNQFVSRDMNALKRINDSTHNSLFEVMTKYYRKTERFFKPATQTKKEFCHSKGGHGYLTTSWGGFFEFDPTTFNFDKMHEN